MIKGRDRNRDRGRGRDRVGTGVGTGVGAGVDALSSPGDIGGCCMYGSVAEGGGKGSASGVWLEGRL